MRVSALIRGLRRDPAFVLGASLSVALAVGANATVFGLVGAVWHPELPVAEAGRLVVAYKPAASSADAVLLDSFPIREFFRFKEIGSFEGVTFELNTFGRMGDWHPVVRIADDGVAIAATAVAHNYFQLLGVPVEGPGLEPAHDRQNSRVAVISRRLRRGRFSSDTAVLGRTLMTSRGPLIIAGVVQSEFTGLRLGDNYDLWLPLGGLPPFSDLAEEVGTGSLTPVTLVARLRPSVAPAAVNAEVTGAIGAQSHVVPLTEAPFRIRSDGDLQRQRMLFQLLGLTAVVVLALGSANLATLSLARAERRRLEYAVRSALGASLTSTANLVLADILVVGVIGMALGAVLSTWLGATISSFELPSGVIVSDLRITVEPETVLIGLSTTMAILLLAATEPIRRGRQLKIGDELRTSPGEKAAIRGRRVIVTIHIAGTVLLVAVAGGFMTTVRSAFGGASGFDHDRTLFVTVRPRASQYTAGAADDPDRRAADYLGLLERLRVLPGVRTIAYGGSIVALQHEVPDESLVSTDAGTSKLPMVVRTVGPGYVGATGVRLLMGRDLDSSDLTRAVDIQGALIRRFNVPADARAGPFREPASVAIVDTVLARTLWPGQNPVGQTFEHGGLKLRYEVIGLIDQIRHAGPFQRNVATLIRPGSLRQDAGANPLRLVIATEGVLSPSVQPVVEDIVRAAFPDPALLQLVSGRGILQRKFAREHMIGSLASAYAALSLALALVGIGGTVMYAIRSRRRELAIRSALGAPAGRLHFLAVKQVMAAIGVGLALGLGASLLAAQVLRSNLFGFETSTTVTMAAAGFVAAVSIVMCTTTSVRELRRLRTGLLQLGQS